MEVKMSATVWGFIFEEWYLDVVSRKRIQLLVFVYFWNRNDLEMNDFVTPFDLNSSTRVNYNKLLLQRKYCMNYKKYGNDPSNIQRNTLWLRCWLDFTFSAQISRKVFLHCILGIHWFNYVFLFWIALYWF